MVSGWQFVCFMVIFLCIGYGDALCKAAVMDVDAGDYNHLVLCGDVSCWWCYPVVAQQWQNTASK